MSFITVPPPLWVPAIKVSFPPWTEPNTLAASPKIKFCTTPFPALLPPVTVSLPSKLMRQRPNLPDPRAVLGPVKAWPGNAGARRKTSATASLDGPCARRVCAPAGRDEGTAARHEQRNSAKQKHGDGR